MAVPAGAYLLLFLLERWLPLRAATRRLWRRLLVNVAISALAFGAAAIFVRPAASYALGFAESSVGLLPLFDLPGPVAFVLGFLAMDLSFYYWHLANHRVPLLWRFHNVHHIDPDLDVTTAFRFHPGEIALSAGFRIVQVLAIGPTLAVYATYELVFLLNTIFHHSNLRLPVRGERILNLLLVTPRMHGIHHSQFHDETDSNFSTVFPWWDRIHHTLRLNVPQQAIVIGVPGYEDDGDHGFASAFLLPFRRQRDYWRKKNGDEMETRPQRSTGSRSQMSE
ncbi:MAG: sterol desaturase family protein [Planctomycetes bacterium]|nr:sterol desaturase family protein [Planctomycetota bacterium]